MRSISWIFIFLAVAVSASAQNAPRWDANLNAGFSGHRPGDGDRYNNWYSEGRYAASIGYYWTEHLKTEFEFAHSGEGQRYLQEIARVPGSGAPYSIPVEAFHRLQQTSLRMVWQFGENAWVHPYVNAGYVLDADRQHRHSPITYSYPGDPRVVPPILVRPAVNTEERIEFRSGGSLGGGAKFFVAPNAYINTGLQWTFAGPAKTITFLSGFGVEF
jgi:hypothetical protein